jgi:hypothetical protein
MGDVFKPDRIIPMRGSTVKRKIDVEFHEPARTIDRNGKTRYKKQHAGTATSKGLLPGYGSLLQGASVQKGGGERDSDMACGLAFAGCSAPDHDLAEAGDCWT